MTNILIAQIHAVGSHARGVMLEMLQTVIDENPDANIYYLTCSNTYNVCYINTEKKPEICFLCKRGVEKGLKLIDGEFTRLRIEDIILEEDKEIAKAFIAQNPEVTKNVKFEDYDVGEAAISSYISKTRDKNMTFIKDSFAEELVENDIIFYNALKRYFEQISFTKVYNFNGRNSYQRAVWRICLQKQVECINKEISRPGGYLDTFPNVLPHHINTRKSLVDDLWKKSPLTLSEKEKIGSSFFENKVQGVPMDTAVFIDNQKKNQLPEGIDYEKRTFVVFTSSDDEFAAVGKDFENPFFKDQNEGVVFVANLFAKKFPDYNLIIRMHPNLKGLNFDYVQEVKALDDIAPNITVIPPESPVDSYALLKVCEKVIVYGSTIGLEASYWGRPVILLGKAFYFYHDVAYVPSDILEIEKLVEGQLMPKPRLDAVKFGFYFLSSGEKAKYFINSFNKKSSFKGKELYDFSKGERFLERVIRQMYQNFGVRLLVK